RQDALCAAADFILQTEQWALQHRQEVVATVGKLSITHSASNTIPGEVICTLDLRSHDAKVLEAAYKTIQDFCASVCKQRNISHEWKLVQETAPVACDSQLNTALAAAIAKSGHELVELVSGAGHDGVPISAVSPIAMLFVRCYKGISHHPLENVAPKDLAAAIEVSANFIEELIKTHTR
ncbi:MAG: M20/M25/M40 family metallo-hydrolase, partial [Bacteroidetes bacterium]|nr:M20/M25/M40 family metallo-hydrolase [Bacteroidota bacterium]